MVTKNKLKKWNSRITNIYYFVKNNPYCQLNEIEFGLDQLHLSRGSFIRTLRKMVNSPIPYLFKTDTDKKFIGLDYDKQGLYIHNPFGNPNSFNLFSYLGEIFPKQDISYKSFLNVLSNSEEHKRFLTFESCYIALPNLLMDLGNISFYYSKKRFFSDLHKIGKGLLKEEIKLRKEHPEIFLEIKRISKLQKKNPKKFVREFERLVGIS